MEILYDIVYNIIDAIRERPWLLAIPIVLILVLFFLMAQPKHATLTVTVKELDGSPIEATVSVIQGDKVYRTFASGGLATFKLLAGEVVIRASASGYETQSLTLELKPGSNSAVLELPLKMEVSIEAESEIEVPVGTEVDVNILLKNDGNTDLIVSLVKSGEASDWVEISEVDVLIPAGLFYPVSIRISVPDESKLVGKKKKLKLRIKGTRISKEIEFKVTKKPKLSLRVQAPSSIKAGELYDIFIKIKSKKAPARNVKINLSGPASEWVALAEQEINVVGKDEEITVSGTILVPKDVEDGRYMLRIEITCPGASVDKTLNFTVTVPKPELYTKSSLSLKVPLGQTVPERLSISNKGMEVAKNVLISFEPLSPNFPGSIRVEINPQGFDIYPDSSQLIVVNATADLSAPLGTFYGQLVIACDNCRETTQVQIEIEVVT